MNYLFDTIVFPYHHIGLKFCFLCSYDQFQLVELLDGNALANQEGNRMNILGAGDNAINSYICHLYTWELPSSWRRVGGAVYVCVVILYLYVGNCQGWRIFGLDAARVQLACQIKIYDLDASSQLER